MRCLAIVLAPQSIYQAPSSGRRSDREMSAMSQQTRQVLRYGDGNNIPGVVINNKNAISVSYPIYIFDLVSFTSLIDRPSIYQIGFHRLSR